jgi:hypothetical protein
MDCAWIKQGNSLRPGDIVTEDMIATFKNGATVFTDQPRRRRNPDFHRLMMAGLAEVVANTYPRFADVEELMDYLKLKSGMVDEIDVGDGRVCLRFKSISFASMDQIKFKAVSEQWREIVLKDFGIDLLEERS